ncbi:MAG: UbiA family prenyltransferase [Chitinophagaceae bacterium]|nr:UbiA family prenyltransferase [Chitinophagaceae bacterium]
MNQPFSKRIWQYQRERFPVFTHGLLIAAFTFSAIAYAHLCRHSAEPIPLISFLKAYVNTFCLFLLLRISDEFKDADYDRANRPHLPVPRGLIQLNELKYLGIAVLILLILFNLIFAPSQLLIFICILLYLLLMFHEFFSKRWLEQHQWAYVISHMMIIPLVDTLASSFDWMQATPDMQGLYWFFAVSFFNGCTLELGRKIKARENEEANSYSSSLGFEKSLICFQAVLLMTFLLCLAAAQHAHLKIGHSIMFVLMYSISAAFGCYFCSHRTVQNAQKFELISALWAIGMYVNLGIGIFML